MALSKKMGTFTLPAAGGTVAVTGVGFQPKLILVFHTGSDNAAGPNYLFGFGAAQSNVAQTGFGNVYWDNVDIATRYPGGQSMSATRFVSRTGLSAGSSWQAQIGNFQTMDVDGFTLIAGASSGTDNLPTYCRYLALGGDDVTVKVGTFDALTASGAQSITGVGFQPKALLLFSNESPSKVIEAQGVFGVAVSAAKQYTTLFSGSDDGTKGYNYNRQLSGKIYTQIQPENQANIEREASLTSLDVDGFTLNWVINAAEGGHTIGYVALAGAASFDTGIFTQPPATGNQDVTSTLAPDALLLFSAAKPTNTGSTAEAKFAFGALTSAADQWAFGGHATHLSNPPDGNKDFESGKALLMMTTTTRNAVASFVQPNAPNGFRLNWSAADATARETIFFGIAASTETIKTITDTGAGSDAVGGLAVTLGVSDTGAGSDALPGTSATVGMDDTASGSDAITQLLASGSVTDSGMGADIIGAIAVALALDDAATCADAIAQLLVQLSLTDAAVGADVVAQLQAQLGLTDDATGTDVVAQLTAALSVADDAVGTDSIADVQALLQITDSGSGDDIVSVLSELLKTITDSGAGSDALAIAASVAITDSGAGADALSLAITLTLTDTGAGADAISILTALLKTIADSGTGTDALAGVTVQASVSDTGAGADAHSVAVTLAVSDTASGLDGVLAGVLIALADSGLGSDALGVTVQAAVMDSGTGADAIGAINVALQIIDTAGGVDAVIAFDTQTRIAKIKFSLRGRTMTLTLKGRKAKFTLH